MKENTVSTLEELGWDSYFVPDSVVLKISKQPDVTKTSKTRIKLTKKVFFFIKIYLLNNPFFSVLRDARYLQPLFIGQFIHLGFSL